jgi:hypothetical protein
MKFTQKQRVALILVAPIFCITLPTLAALIRPVFGLPDTDLGRFLSFAAVSILDISVIAFTVWNVKGLPTAYAVASSILMLMEYVGTHTVFPWHEIVAAVLFAILIPLATWNFSEVFAAENKAQQQGDSVQLLANRLDKLETNRLQDLEQVSKTMEQLVGAFREKLNQLEHAVWKAESNLTDLMAIDFNGKFETTDKQLLDLLNEYTSLSFKFSKLDGYWVALGHEVKADKDSISYCKDRVAQLEETIVLQRNNMDERFLESDNALKRVDEKLSKRISRGKGGDNE